MKPKTKKVAMGIIGLCLIVALTIGGTLAYLTRQTETRVNNFTFASADDALNAMLTEPDWDGIVDYEYDADGNFVPVYGYNGDGAAIYGYTNGEKQDPVTDKAHAADATTTRAYTDRNDPSFAPVYGIDQAVNLVPTATIAKNPIVTNKGTLCDAWVALKMTFVNAKTGKPLSDEDLAKVLAVINIDYKTTASDKWERIEGNETSVSQVFYYNELLAKDSNPAVDVYGGVTDPLFTTVTIKAEATNEQIDAVEAIGGFIIYIEGFVAQSDVAETYEAFKTWGATGVTFANTPSDVGIKLDQTIFGAGESSLNQ